MKLKDKIYQLRDKMIKRPLNCYNFCIKRKEKKVMKKDNMQKFSIAGNVSKEMKEIKNLQVNKDSFLSISTNTCGEVYTVFCC